MDNIVEAGDLTEGQLKALYDPIRIRIASSLKTPHTPKQVAEILDIKANNLYHHFRVLVKAGIIKHVETKKGKGFIKEEFFCLVLPMFKADNDALPNLQRQQFFFGLFQALMDDFKTTAARHDTPYALGVREDFRFSKDDLLKARKIIEKHHETLYEELVAIADQDGTPNYQLSIFSFRV